MQSVNVFLSSQLSLNPYVESVYINCGQDRECSDCGKRYHNIFQYFKNILLITRTIAEANLTRFKKFNACIIKA